MFLPHLGVKIGFVLKGQGSFYDNLEFSPTEYEQVPLGETIGDRKDERSW